MSAKSDQNLEKASLPLYKEGFVILSTTPVERNGTYGTYHWGYRVRMKSAAPSNKKTYAVELARSDETLGCILWVWAESPNKGIVFTKTLSGGILGSAKEIPDEALDKPDETQNPTA